MDKKTRLSVTKGKNPKAKKKKGDLVTLTDCDCVIILSSQFNATFIPPVGRALTSDWSTYSFIMIVCEKEMLKFSQDFLFKIKNVLVYNYYRAI